MPRIARKNSQSCFYHVIVQGINKEYIFQGNKYIKKYKEIIINKKKESQVAILAYCIMSNHAHFLLYSEQSQYLSKFMQRINTAYSCFYNKSNKRVGYVFRDRYYSQNILNKKQLYNCLKYIHNNPLKAHICTTVDEYKYSSYNEFIGKKEIIDNNSIKILFGSDNDFVNKFYYIHSNREDYKEKFIDVKEENILEFIQNVEKEYGKGIKELKNNRKLLEKIIKEARNNTNVTLKELANILDVSKSTVWNYDNR